jgi:hypothetical protein
MSSTKKESERGILGSFGLMAFFEIPNPFLVASGFFGVQVLLNNLPKSYPN